MDKKKITNMEVKRKNRNEVFRYICRKGMVSNPDISYELKLSLPTATQITKELIERGLVEEKGEMESTGGRKAKALAVSGSVGKAAGVDITKNHISLVLTELSGRILKYERITTWKSAGSWNAFWKTADVAGKAYWELEYHSPELLTWIRN